MTKDFIDQLVDWRDDLDGETEPRSAGRIARSLHGDDGNPAFARFYARPDMGGSAKQVDWARSIRNRVCQGLPDVPARVLAKIDNPTPKDSAAAVLAVIEVREALDAYMASARRWIDARDVDNHNFAALCDVAEHAALRRIAGDDWSADAWREICLRWARELDEVKPLRPGRSRVGRIEGNFALPGGDDY